MDKKSRLDNLLDMTKNVDKKEYKFEYLSDQKFQELKEKFPILIGTKQLKIDEIKEGTLIRYIDKEFTKVSIQGSVTKIEYFSELSNSQIKTIYLYNRYTKTDWKINPYKVIMFKDNRKSKLVRFIAGDFMIEEISKYKKSLKDKTINNL